MIQAVPCNVRGKGTNQPLLNFCIVSCVQVDPGNQDTAETAASMSDGHCACAICLEELPAELMHVIGSCLHRFCVKCLGQYLRDRLAGCLLPMPCPQPGCKDPISTPECRLLLQSHKASNKLAEVSRCCSTARHQDVSLSLHWEPRIVLQALSLQA